MVPVHFHELVEVGSFAFGQRQAFAPVSARQRDADGFRMDALDQLEPALNRPAFSVGVRPPCRTSPSLAGFGVERYRIDDGIQLRCLIEPRILDA